MQNKWLRLLKHRLFDVGDARRALDRAALQRLHERVVASERQHSGEIRICVEAGLPWSYLRRNATPRERAVAMFGKLRVWDTHHNNGVLIYLLLAEHAIEIVADRGLNQHVPASHWAEVAAHMSAAFRERHFAEGLAAAVDEVHALLLRHFPLGVGEVNPDELPNAVVLL